MDTRVLEIVFYLMDQFEEADDQFSNLSEFSSDMKSLGYSEEEISNAYNLLLDNISDSGESLFSGFPEQRGATRILTSAERARLTPEAHGFLLRLSNIGVISNEQLEKILDRLNLMGPRLVSSDQVRLVTSAVLFSEQTEPGRGLLRDGEVDLSSRVN